MMVQNTIINVTHCEEIKIHYLPCVKYTQDSVTKTRIREMDALHKILLTSLSSNATRALYAVNININLHTQLDYCFSNLFE